MLQSFYARAMYSKNPKHKFKDKKAEEIVEKLDYDFSRASKDAAMSGGVVARTVVLDELVSDFIRKNPDCTVVNIACGLDTRFYRMDNGKITWYNLDLPETIAVRDSVYGETGRVSTIGCSCFDPAWPSQVTKRGKMLFIIEGLTMYLYQEDVQRIFQVIARRFSQADVLVETMNPMVVKRFREKSIDASHARFTWGVKNGAALVKLLPGFHFIKEHSLTEGMAQFVPVYKLLDKLPAIRNISNKIVVLEKG